MSQLSVSSIQNTASATTNLVLNTDGSTTVALPSTGVAPTPTQTGTLWYDASGVVTGDSTVLIWDGAAWVGTIGATAATLAEAALGVLTTKFLSPETGVPKNAAGMSGAAILPSGTAASAPAGAAGYTRVATDRGQLTFFANGAYFPVGFGAGGLTTTTAVGLGALAANTGAGNTAVGSNALAANTTGRSNTAAGTNALAANDTGVYNTAVGCGALCVSVSANNNTAVGFNSLCANISGICNTAIGASSLRENTLGTNNTGLGMQALRFNTSGGCNTAAGKDALRSNIIGNNNTAVGFNALYANNADHNTSVGVTSMRFNDTGCYNTAFGSCSLLNNTSGNNNVANGFCALAANTTGGSNTAIGRTSLLANTVGTSNTALGANALLRSDSIGNTGIGQAALCNVTSGDYNLGLGISGGNTITTGSGNVMLGGITSAGVANPVFGITTQDNRVSIGSAVVTNAYIQVAWQVISDARDKIVEGSVPHGLEFVKQLEPKAYRFRVNRDSEEPNGPLRYGFLAQDIQAIEGEPSVIIDDENPEKLSLHSDALVPVLVNAIKELAADFEEYKRTHP